MRDEWRREIDDLAFWPTTAFTIDDDGPIRGEALVFDVPYTFERTPNDDPNTNSWGTWFDLTPIDETQGLPIRAMGRFRGTTSARWTIMGSPALKNGPHLREQFCGFLERLADETSTGAHWAVFMVAHYQDSDMEQVRIECVRMFHKRVDCSRFLTDAERDTINAWGTQLRECTEEQLREPEPPSGSI